MSKILPSSRPKKSPYTIKLRRNMPIEIFILTHVCFKENCLQPNEKKTRSTITVCLLSQEDLKVLFGKGRRPKKTKKASWQSSCEDLLLPDLGRKGHTELCCGPNNPVKVRFSYSVSLYSFILATGIRMVSHDTPSSNQTVNMQFG